MGGAEGVPLIWVRALRPRQWTKNLAVYAALLFAKRVFVLASFEKATCAVARPLRTRTLPRPGTAPTTSLSVFHRSTRSD